MTTDLEAAKSESIFVNSARKASFAFTCAWIEKWAASAGAAYLSGKSPTPESVALLAKLVGELGTGTAETKSIKVTVADVAGLAHLGSSSLTPYVAEWGTPESPQAGRRCAQYNLMKLLPILREQFPHIDDDDWNALVIRKAV